MRTDTLAQIALAVFVIGGIIAGLLVVGGPGQGRMERRDATRLGDIHALAGYVACLARHNDMTLPEKMTEAAHCPGAQRLRDPFTDAPYLYERLSDSSYRICAVFEAPDRITYYSLDSFDRASGCVTHLYTP